MTQYNNLLLENKGGIMVITVNRPNKMNALNIETVKELNTAMQEVYDDPEVRGVILTGSGEKAFVAGADIAEIAELNEVNGRRFAERGQDVFSMIEESPKPVIAAVNGFALGGGCELAMACHIRVASENARFGQPEVNLGIIPGYGGTQRLTQLVGKGRAMELMMTGDMISAAEAKEYGLVNHVTAPEGLMEKCLEIMQKIVAKAPLAVGMIVDCVNAWYDKEENGYQTEANSFSRCCGSDDFKEGTAAFLEKRKPVFKGE
ncbi:enoyl-CoA hydratase/isomerase family protein [Sabulibacter ruber]|uniref:enoyl-CoA hydratase/isomerase family protein n=1 Tax=Sabulibacter ruber TaxID=2811901 RepID=UPI001A971ACE|nr:enoyl-CoA hydratase-related protein [Sabulibacter ruber]